MILLIREKHWVVACLLSLSQLTASAWAQIYNCDGQWTNTACSTSAPVFDEVQSNSLEKAPTVTESVEEIDQSEINIRTRQFDRSAPKVILVRSQVTGERRYRLLASVRSTGRTRINAKLRWRGHDSDRWREKSIGTKNVNFDGRDIEKEIDFEFRVPQMAARWEWYVYAKFSSPNWRGYYDLTGCCSHHDGITPARCESGGEVLCGDGKPSPTCRCGE